MSSSFKLSASKEDLETLQVLDEEHLPDLIKYLIFFGRLEIYDRCHCNWHGLSQSDKQRPYKHLHLE